MADPSQDQNGTEDLPVDYLPDSVTAQMALDRLGKDNTQSVQPGWLDKVAGLSPKQPAPSMAVVNAYEAVPQGHPGPNAIFGQGGDRSIGLTGATSPIPDPGEAPAPQGFQNPSNIDWGGQQAAQATQQAQPQQPMRMGGGGGGSSQDIAQLQAGVALQKQGLLSQADVEGQRGKVEQEILNSGLDDEGKFAAWQKAHGDQMEDFVNRQQQTTQKLMEDFRANSKVNPNAYWDNMGAGQRVGNALALVLSGIGSGITGQQNMAQQVISDGIKNNIDAQVHNIQTKRQAIDDQNNMVAQYMKNGMDLSEAKHAALATQTQMVKDRIAANVAGYASPMAKAAAQQAAGKLDMDTAEHASALRSASLQRAATAQSMRFQAANEGWALQNRQGLINALQGGQVDLANPEIAARAVRLPDGSTSIAARPEDAEKARGIVTAGTAYSNALQRVYQTTSVAPAMALPGTEGAAAREARETAIAEAKAAAHQYMKIKAGGKEGDEGFGVPPKLLDQLSGEGPINPLQRKETLEHIKQLHDDHLADMKDQLRANNVRLRAEHKRTSIGG